MQWQDRLVMVPRKRYAVWSLVCLQLEEWTRCLLGRDVSVPRTPRPFTLIVASGRAVTWTRTALHTCLLSPGVSHEGLWRDRCPQQSGARGANGPNRSAASQQESGAGSPVCLQATGPQSTGSLEG